MESFCEACHAQQAVVHWWEFRGRQEMRQGHLCRCCAGKMGWLFRCQVNRHDDWDPVAPPPASRDFRAPPAGGARPRG